MEEPVNAVTVSPKFQVVIPKEIREQLDLAPGQKLQMIAYDDRIEMVPVRAVQSLRGVLKGIDTRVPRDKDRP
jgi:AbrB family looped-hinge helix DNA binding protein